MKNFNLKKGVLLLGDAALRLKEIQSESVDLVVTSPPYDNLRTYKGFTFDFETTARELTRCLKPGGVIVWNVADATVNGSETGTSFRQALYFKDECGLNLHDTMIFAKNNPIPGNQGLRYRQSFEYVFALSKGRPKTFAPVAYKIKEKLSFNESIRFEQEGRRGYKRTLTGHINGEELAHQDGQVVRIKGYKEPETSMHPNIFFYTVGKKAKGQTNHSAVFPDELAEDQIRTWTNPGDLVLDPFSGSGTTARMAAILDRRYVAIEISKEYLEASIPLIEEAENFEPIFAEEEHRFTLEALDFD